MKRFIIYPILTLIILCSCGEDRTYEYLELTQENQWIFEKMQDLYLWNDSIKTPKQQQFFAENSLFFESLLQKEDKFSYFADSAIASSYGINYILFRDPLGIQNSKSYALVRFVEPESPAYKAGLKRGDWISKVGNNNLTSSNFGYLDRGNATTLYTSKIEFNEEKKEYMWVNSDTLQLGTATKIDTKDIYRDTIYTERTHKIGYIVCNKFSDKSIDYLKNVINNFKQNNITDMLIDLRYNIGGSISVANEFASMIVPTQHNEKTFCSLIYNKTNSYKDTIYKYIDTNTIAFDKIYIICGTETRGAGEIFIDALRNTLGYNNTIVMGETTYGEDVVTETMESPYNFTINPVVAYIGNNNNERAFPYGITPNYFLNEFTNFYNIYPIGSKQEYMLYNALFFIVNGYIPNY